MNRNLFAVCLLLMMSAGACNEYEDPPPPPLPTVPDPPATRFNINGRWDGKTDQGRPIRFDVKVNESVVETKISLHHDCSGGRLVLQLNGYDGRVNADSFSGTVIWRWDEEGGKWYVGTLTVSGTFTGDKLASGAFINSITEKQADNLGVCGPTNGTWEATKSE